MVNATLRMVVTLPMLLPGLFNNQTDWLDGIAKKFGYQSVYHHAVIIDSGSTGSRVLAYKFRVPFSVFSHAILELEYEYYAKTHPGLSSYVDNPDKGANKIVKLIRKAQFLTPSEKRRSTPLIVRATAGLRLLPAEKAQQLIDHVAKAIAALGYDVTADSVKIMDGSDEGIFSWYAVNLLNNLMGGETMAALDLGGGSTQITYQISEEERPNYPSSDTYVLPAGENITIYTHSYLNLGLLAARYGVFRLEAGNNSTNEFTSVCVDPLVQRETWTYANKVYSVSGAARSQNTNHTAVYSACHGLVRRYILATLDWKPTHAPKGKVAAMNQFYGVAADAGIINAKKGGTVSVSQYRASAQRACSSHNVEQPWACVDLVYMVALLQDAYKLQDDKPISLIKKEHGHRVTWALGLAYTTIMNKIYSMID